MLSFSLSPSCPMLSKFSLSFIFLRDSATKFLRTFAALTIKDVSALDSFESILTLHPRT